MKITLKLDTNMKMNAAELIFTDEQLDNPNYVDLIVDGKEFTVNKGELKRAVEAL